MTYERLTTYFLSGTGNSYKAATWLVAEARGRGIASEQVPIEDARPREDLEGGEKQLVGIYHPAHGLMPPWSMIKFLLRLPRGRGAHAMVVPTRGAIPIRPVLIPGACGMALFFPMLVLMLKGYRVRGGTGIDMPVNLNMLHWGMSDENAAHIEAWGGRRHKRLVDAVLAGRTYVHPLNVLWELIWCAPFVFWPVFPLVYLVVARVFMGKLMFAGTRCTGCGLCAKNCPAGAIKMVGEKKTRVPFWTRRCESCMRCAGYCKPKAVETSHMWMALVIVGTSFICAANVEKLVEHVLGYLPGFVPWVSEPAAVLLTWPAIIVVYWLFFALQRVKPLRLLFEYTSLTRIYKRRHHAPGTTSKEMRRRS